MPDAARKWLEKHEDWQKNAPDEPMPMSYVKSLIAAPAADHLRRLLAENERLEAEMAGMMLMEAEGQSFAETIVRDTERLQLAHDDARQWIGNLEATNAAQAQTIKAAHIRTLEVSTRYNDCQQQVERLRKKLELFRSCMGDGGDLEYAAGLLRTATNDHGVNQMYNNNPYAVSEQLEAMGAFLGSELEAGGDDAR